MAFARLLFRAIRGRNAGTPEDGATRLLVLCFVCLFFSLGRRWRRIKECAPTISSRSPKTTVDNSSRIIYNQPLRVLSHTITLCPHWLHYFSQIIIILRHHHLASYLSTTMSSLHHLIPFLFFIAPAFSQYTATYSPYSLPDTSEQGQYGTNACGTSSSQDSKCQNVYVNGVDDFCLWGPPETTSDEGDGTSKIGNVEQIVVRWVIFSF